MDFHKLIDDVYKSNYDPRVKDKLAEGLIKMWQVQNLQSGGDGSVEYSGVVYRVGDSGKLPEPPPQQPPTPPSTPPTPPSTEQKSNRGRKPKLEVNKEDLRKKLFDINLDDL